MTSNINNQSAGTGAKQTVLAVALFGSLWGLAECTAGIFLRGTCSRLYTGSILTGLSFFYMAGALGLAGGGGTLARGRAFTLMLMPLIAALFRVYAGLLMGQKIISGAVANPVYAFITEGLVFCALVAFAGRERLSRLVPAAMGGIASAVAAAVIFVPVVVFTTIPACVLPGTRLPLSIFGMPVAAALGAVALPAGLQLGAWMRHRLDAQPRERAMVLLTRASAAVTVVCAVVLTLLYMH